MSRRQVCKRLRPDGTGYRVFRNSHTDEWLTEFYTRGKCHDGATYFTDDRQDAVATGEYWLTSRHCAAEQVFMETVEGVQS